MAVLRHLPACIASTLIVILLGGCASTPLPDGWKVSTPADALVRKPAHPPLDLPLLPPAKSGKGGYYQDDGPGENAPANLRDIPDAVVRAEPLSRSGNRTYSVFGKTYTPMTDEQPFVQRGMSSWYGKKFHGQRTSSGEIYDMYKMTAAHPTLPIPSFARIRNLSNGKQVVVRVNDRGPFHAGRIVDVSYTAALKLGLLERGSHMVELERLLPDSVERLGTIRRNAPEPVSADPYASGSLDQGLAKAETFALAALTPDADADPVDPPPGYYLQFGAFGAPSKAAEVRARLAGEWSQGPAIMVVAGALHRVLSGPFASRDLALGALREVPAALGVKPIIVKR
ncbi:MAG: septal ring lytic transglycosylase RlpA family protein [Pseudomonadota bacterium]